MKRGGIRGEGEGDGQSGGGIADLVLWEVLRLPVVDQYHDFLCVDISAGC